jgi:hypothetical protein
MSTAASCDAVGTAPPLPVVLFALYIELMLCDGVDPVPVAIV